MPTISHRPGEHKEFAPFRSSAKADTVRLYGRYSLGLLLRSLLFVRTFRPVFTMRLCQAASRLPGPVKGLSMFLCRVLHRWTQHGAGIDLPWMTDIGPGFLINHGWGLVVSHGSTIGGNVTVFHGVTIGQKDKISDGGRVTSYAVVEDEAWIGAHAVIVGGIVVGRGSRMAPGTVATGNIEPRSVVGGNPMRVIRTNELSDVVNPAVLSL